MPRSASTSKRNVSSGRGRFQPQPMESELDRTPVLFRLPEVEISPSEPESSSTENVLPTEEYQDEYQTPPEEFLPEDFQSELITAPLRRSQLDLPSAKEVEPSLQENTGTRTEPNTETTAVAEEEKPGSWWEHWSSGVVLILLIIALVTASIIAFNDAKEPEADLLAEDEQKDEFSLSEIVIPEMQTDLAEAVGTESAAESNPMVPPLSIPTQPANNIVQQEPNASESEGLLLENLPDLNPTPENPASEIESRLADQTVAPAATSFSSPGMSLSEDLQFAEPTPALPASPINEVTANQNNTTFPVLPDTSENNLDKAGGELSLELPPLAQQDSQLLPPLTDANAEQPQNVDLTNLKPAIPEPQLTAGSTASTMTPSSQAIPETPAPTYDSILKLPIPTEPATTGNVQTVAGGSSDAQISITGHRSPPAASQPNTSGFAPANSGQTPTTNVKLPSDNVTATTATGEAIQNNTPELRRTATAEGNEDAIIRAWQSFRPSSNRYQ